MYKVIRILVLEKSFELREIKRVMTKVNVFQNNFGPSSLKNC